jgi:hypothetical protein
VAADWAVARTEMATAQTGIDRAARKNSRRRAARRLNRRPRTTTIARYAQSTAQSRTWNDVAAATLKARSL